MPRSLLDTGIRQGGPPSRWSRRWRFLAVLVAAAIGWLIPATILYLAWWRD